MTPVFADTSFFIAFLCEDDADHPLALQLARDLAGPVITTRWIVVELGNFLRRPSQRDQFAAFIARLEASHQFQILPADESSFHAGLKLYSGRSDKGWSLTDCISFAIMQHLGIEEALTTDHHFEQAGFRRFATPS